MNKEADAPSRCESCGVLLCQHLGLYGTCAELLEARAEIERLKAELRAGEASDGHHTHNELYAYRMAFNALFFNLLAKMGACDVHKSRKHSDGEPCFGGGWFIVVAQLDTGQISNHYREEHWDLFSIPERELPAAYDGHTPAIALKRMMTALMPEEENPEIAATMKALRNSLENSKKNRRDQGQKEEGE